MTRRFRFLFALALATIGVSSLNAQSSGLKTFDVCRDSPTDRESAWWIPDPDRPGTIAAVYHPPVDGDYREFIGIALDARDQVERFFDSRMLGYRIPEGAIATLPWKTIPHIKWLSYDFWVGTGADFSQPHPESNGGACAAGLTDQYFAEDGWRRQIVISYRLRDRVAALVQWESVNFWLGQGGRSDRQDRFVIEQQKPGASDYPYGRIVITPDSNWIPPMPKRRATG